MNFYFEAVGVLDKLGAKKGSIKGVLASVPEKNRKRTAALVIETLKRETTCQCPLSFDLKPLILADKQVLSEVIDAAQLLKQERKINSRNLALVLVHDLLLAKGIQAGDGPIKQAVLRHRTRLNSEFQRVKIKRGAKSIAELARADDTRAGELTTSGSAGCDHRLGNSIHPAICACQPHVLDSGRSRGNFSGARIPRWGPVIILVSSSLHHD